MVGITRSKVIFRCAFGQHRSKHLRTALFYSVWNSLKQLGYRALAQATRPNLLEIEGAGICELFLFPGMMMLVTASFFLCLSSALACVADKVFCYQLGKDYSAGSSNPEQKITWSVLPSHNHYEFEFTAVGSDITIYYLFATGISSDYVGPYQCDGKVAAGQRGKVKCSGLIGVGSQKLVAVAESSSVTAQVCSPFWTYPSSAWQRFDYWIDGIGTKMPEFSPVQKVVGQWVRIAQISTETEFEYMVGTSFTETTSTSEEFTQAMTHATSETVSFTVEVGIEGKVFGGGSSSSVETTTSEEWTNEFKSSFTQEKSSTFSKEDTVTYSFSTDMIGRNLWQFKIATSLCSDETVETASRDIALTGSAVDGPCCYPGHCRDQKSYECSYCNPGFRIRTTSDCFEGEPPCLEKTLQLSTVTGYVTVPSMADGEKTIDCPSPFQGTIVVACEDQTLSIIESCRNPTWSHGEWGVCSEVCGGGSQTRTVTCSSSDGLCSGTRPESQQTCNTQQCIWLQGTWSTCSEVCAGGARSRTVQCQRQGFCQGSEPAREETCNTETCQWSIGPWQDCSQLCAGGVRSRSVSCPRSGYCEDASKPEAEGTCNTADCQWSAGDWSKCSQPCAGGVHSRSVSCPRSGYCDDASKPEAEGTCNMADCQWSAGDWSNCSQPCAGGVHSRSVSCPRSGYCDDASKPEAEGTCNIADCQWSVGDWDECSMPCGGGGSQTRTIKCPRPGSCRASLPNSSRSCYEGPCIWEFEDWSSCSRACGVGTRERRVWCYYPGECQGTAPRQTMNCTGDACSAEISGCRKASNTRIFEVLLMFGMQRMLLV